MVSFSHQEHLVGRTGLFPNVAAVEGISSASKLPANTINLLRRAQAGSMPLSNLSSFMLDLQMPIYPAFEIVPITNHLFTKTPP